MNACKANAHAARDFVTAAVLFMVVAGIVWACGKSPDGPVAPCSIVADSTRWFKAQYTYDAPNNVPPAPTHFSQYDVVKFTNISSPTLKFLLRFDSTVRFDSTITQPRPVNNLTANYELTGDSITFSNLIVYPDGHLGVSYLPSGLFRFACTAESLIINQSDPVTKVTKRISVKL